MKSIKNNVVCGGRALTLPAHLSLGQYVVERLKRNCDNGDTAALINGDTGYKTTGKEILQEIVNVASGLTRMGVKRGDVVALCSENRGECITAAIGAVCCGATVTFVNVVYVKDELIHALEISRPSAIFCSEATLGRYLSILKSLSYIKNIIQLNGTPVESDITAYSSVMVETDAREYEPAAVQGWEDVVFILYSSGTTGLPKGVMLTHVNINALIAVPPVVIFFAKSPLVKKFDVSSINVIWCGGAPLCAEVSRVVLKRIPNCKRIIQAYGMTEVTLSAMKDYDEYHTTEKPGSCGYPIPGVTAKVVDVNTRKKLEANQDGEICLKGPILMKGYVNNEGASRDMIDEEGYLKTGDIGYYDADGCFYIVDRLKELIKYNGHQVAPAAVERVLLQHSGVAECGVVGAPDELAGELPTAFVVAKPGLLLTETELLRFTDERLSQVMRLRGGIVFVNEIPRNGSGKILRRELKQRILYKN